MTNAVDDGIHTASRASPDQLMTNEVDDGRGLDWRRLLSLAWPERWLLLAGSIGLLVSSSANLVIIGVAGRMVDVLVKRPDDAEQQLWWMLFYLCITFVAASFMTFVRAYYFTLAGERVVARLRAQLFAHIIEQEIGFFDSNRTGDTLSRLSDDCSALQSAVTTNVSMLLRNLVTAFGTLLIIFFISWTLTLVMVAVVPMLAVSAVRYGKFVKSISKRVQDALADASATAEEAVSNIRTVRSFASEAWNVYCYQNKLEAAFVLAKRRTFAYGAFSGGMFLLANIALIGVLFYGGRLVLANQLTVGDLLSFIMYTISLAASLGMITSLFNDFMKAVGASKRVFQLLDREPKVAFTGGETVPSHISGAVDLRKVCFSYPSRPDQVVLGDFSLSITAGQTVALVGPSGGGKSTVAALVLRFYDPQQGAVMIDGVDVRSLNRRALMRHVAVVMQEPVLFATSIRDNIQYGLLEPPEKFVNKSAFNVLGASGLGGRVVDDKESLIGDLEMGVVGRNLDMQTQVEAAAKSANASEFIRTFEQGFDTLVGERGVRLSGGQKQRVAIARALLKQPKILLLDEATSALDSESERVVQASIDQLLQERGRTVLVVAHRLSTIRNADSIAVIDRGALVQVGPHDQLIQDSNGLYAKLVSKQMISHDA